METSLHRSLKARYGPDLGGRSEVEVAGYRIDALAPDGELVEIQCGPLGAIRSKVRRLLDLGHHVRVVKPIVVRRRIVRLARPDGPALSTRWSPRRGAPIDLFEDLVGLAALLPHPNLVLDVPQVAIDELRLPRPRGYSILDRRFHTLMGLIKIEIPHDLRLMLPALGPEPFTTCEIAEATGRPDWFAQKVAYCLRVSGAACAVGKVGNRWVYEFPARSAQPATWLGTSPDHSPPAPPAGLTLTAGAPGSRFADGSVGGLSSAR